MKLETGLALWSPGLIVEVDIPTLAMMEMIGAVVDGKDCLATPPGLGLTLISPVMMANHNPQCSFTSPDLHGNGQGLGLSESPDSHARQPTTFPGSHFGLLPQLQTRTLSPITNLRSSELARV